MTPQEHDVMRSVEDRYWWYQALRQHVAASLQPASHQFSLLDAGCGTGGMLDVVRQSFPEADLTGIDASSHAIELAAARETSTRRSSRRTCTISLSPKIISTSFSRSMF